MTDIIILIIGVYWIVVGLRIVIAPAASRALIDVFEDNPALTFFGGLILMIAGIAVLAKHNLWGTPREMFASTVLWIATIEGALMVIAPNLLFTLGRVFIPNDKIFRLVGLALVIMGAVVIYFWDVII